MKANKVIAAASAAMMAMGMLTVPAFAIGEIVSPCAICGGVVDCYVTADRNSTLTYQTYFKVSDITNLGNNEDYMYRVFPHDNSTAVFVATYKGDMICSDCLESKVNEANQGSTVPDADGSHTGSTNVTAEVPGDYTITVPETVALTGDTGSGEKTATVKVTLKGDVAEDQTVTVTVNDPVMKRSGAQDVPVAVTAPKTSWNRDELLNDGTSSDYVVKATLTPGDWTGIMTFECNLA